MVLIFIYAHSLPFYIENQILYTPSQGKWSMFYILLWQFEWMNMSMTFSTEIKQNVVAIFVINGMLSCLPCFVNKNVDINFRSVLICFYIFNDNFFFYLRFVCEMKMTILSYIVICLPICWLTVTYKLTFRRIQRIFNQQHPGYTS